VSATAHDPVQWFTEHFDEAAGKILDFLDGDGISLEGRRVGDIGCGDGIIDLGVALKGPRTWPRRCRIAFASSARCRSRSRPPTSTST
jgi:hypothetical protein